MQYLVTMQIDGMDVPAGTLFQNIRNGEETTSFVYDQQYLAREDAFALAPDVPLGGGSFHSAGLRSLRALEDCMPDRWGKNLMTRAERLEAKNAGRTPRTLFETDLLTGVNDETRQGALRLWDADGNVLTAPETGVPREIDLPHLLSSADRASQDMDVDIRDLLDAGSSLGGARPKASMRDEHGDLWMAKFPKSAEGHLEDVGAWEHTCLLLMEACGITTPSSRCLRIVNRSVLLIKRFDRKGAMRLPYISGLTAVQGEDGGSYSLLELVEFLESNGSAPEKDLPELWLRALFGCVVGNTDNHLRNFGFLHSNRGWRLAPVFDVNPTPGAEPKRFATALGFDEQYSSVREAVALSEYFHVAPSAARATCRELAKRLRNWRVVARKEGIAEASIEWMGEGIDRQLAELANC